MTSPTAAPAPLRPKAWRGSTFSPRCALIVLAGLLCAGCALLGGIALFATRLSMAPERALILSGAAAVALAFGFGALAAVKSRRLGFWETSAVGIALSSWRSPRSAGS